METMLLAMAVLLPAKLKMDLPVPLLARPAQLYVVIPS
jgi:hypothetical protein